MLWQWLYISIFIPLWFPNYTLPFLSLIPVICPIWSTVRNDTHMGEKKHTHLGDVVHLWIMIYTPSKKDYTLGWQFTHLGDDLHTSVKIYPPGWWLSHPDNAQMMVYTTGWLVTLQGDNLHTWMTHPKDDLLTWMTYTSGWLTPGWLFTSIYRWFTSVWWFIQHHSVYTSGWK